MYLQVLAASTDTEACTLLVHPGWQKCTVRERCKVLAVLYVCIRARVVHDNCKG